MSEVPPFSPPNFPNGELSRSQRILFEKWINSRASLIGKCGVCGSRQWGILDHFVDLPIYRGGNVMIGGGPAYPHVGLICQHCGNTNLINATLSGVYQNQSSEPVPSEPLKQGDGNGTE